VDLLPQLGITSLPTGFQQANKSQAVTFDASGQHIHQKPHNLTVAAKLLIPIHHSRPRHDAPLAHFVEHLPRISSLVEPHVSADQIVGHEHPQAAERPQGNRVRSPDVERAPAVTQPERDRPGVRQRRRRGTRQILSRDFIRRVPVAIIPVGLGAQRLVLGLENLRPDAVELALFAPPLLPGAERAPRQAARVKRRARSTGLDLVGKRTAA